MPDRAVQPRTEKGDAFWLRELFEAKLQNIDVRLEAMDKAVALLQAFADRTPTTKDVQHQVVALREVTMQAFADIRTAVETAFSTNAASINKSDVQFTKQVDAIQATSTAQVKNFDDKINDIKDRITTIETKASSYGQAWAFVVAGVGMVVGVIGAVAYIVGMAARH